MSHNYPRDASEASRHFNHACYHGLFDDALALLARGADPLWSGESGKCGLHFAAMAGHAELCSFLSQQHPMCLLAQDQAGMTPLHLACRNSMDQAAMALGRSGAPFNARDDFGRIPLECCPSSSLSNALNLLQVELASEEWAIFTLAQTLAAPSIRSFI